jgi:hypothetical protein
MLERESGHINDKYRLWQTIILEDGTEECVSRKFHVISMANLIIRYRHRITRARIKNGIKPNERGGGILADEMGMGKSLSILALIVKTLDDGKGWVQQQDNSISVAEPIKRSRATLVIVPSARLLFSFWNQIRDIWLTQLNSPCIQLDKRSRKVGLYVFTQKSVLTRNLGI